MNVLSLFDGISGARLALDEARIPITNYYASEIDKYAMKISQANYPDNKQLGDITNWKNWELPKIDLIIGGFPCQSFSIAGKRANDLTLFNTLVDIIRTLQPKYILLENVKGLLSINNGETFKYIMNKLPECTHILINSALLTAQNRERVYITNIPNIQQPEDKGILLKDIIENDIFDRLAIIQRPRGYNKGGIFTEKSPTLSSNSWQHNNHLCIQIGEADLNGHDSIKRVYSIDGKSPTLTTCTGGNREPKINIDNLKWRKLTPLECERLQGVKENFTANVSNSQRYKALGNGFTIPVIAHILKNIVA